MFRVKNSKVITKLSRRSLKAGKARNIIVVAAIVLTSVMFTALFSVGTSMIESFQLETMRMVGTKAHGGYKFISMPKYEKIAADPEVKDISYNIIIGIAENPELAKTPTQIRYTEEKAAEWSFSVPTTGTLPKERLDIATTTDVLDALGVPHELGAAVPLEFTVNGEKYREDFTLCGFWENELVLDENEAYLSREYSDAVAPVWQDGQETDAFPQSGSVNVSLWFRSAWNIEKQMSDLSKRCGFGPEVNEGVNWAYMSDTVDMFTIALIIGLLALIMLSGYLVIYNIFYISVNGKIKFYGLLKTVGTTNRQLKKLVHREALLLSVIGIPIGLLIGYALSALLVPALVGITDTEVYTISVNPFIFVGSGIFTLITVWISCLKPCRLVCRISPVEAARYNDKSSVRKKRKRTRRVTPLSMAVANLSRTKKKTAAAASSLSLALILLNATFSFAHGFDMDKYLQDNIISDFYVTDAAILSSFSGAGNFNSITPDVQYALETLDGITETSHVYMREYQHILNDNERQKAKELLDECAANGADAMHLLQSNHYLDQGQMCSHIYGTDGFAESKMKIIEGNFEREKFESGRYIVAAVGGRLATGRKIWEIGDKVTLIGQDGQPKEYEVMALGCIPDALSPGHSHGFDAYFTLPSSEFISLTGETGAMNLAFNVEPDKIDAVDSQLKNYCGSVNTALDYRSKQSYIDEFNGTQSTFLLVGGLLSFILGLIGILNFINAIITSIRSRRQELAVLQSVGMTGKQLKQMLMGEGAFYILFTALLTLTFGSLLTYALMHTLENVSGYFSYHFIIAPILIVIPILFVLAAVIPVISYVQMCRHSVVDRLREVNE